MSASGHPMDDRDPFVPFCDGGQATCDVCVGSCGIEEYEEAIRALEREADSPTTESTDP